jgi:hypothetical protein
MGWNGWGGVRAITGFESLVLGLVCFFEVGFCEIVGEVSLSLSLEEATGSVRCIDG